MPTPLQMKIIETLKVKPVIDAAQEVRTRVDFLKDVLLSTPLKGFTLGISGGLDSCLSGRLLQTAVSEIRAETGDNQYKFVAMLLPYGKQSDFADAVDIAANFIAADEIIELNIKPMVDAFEATYNASVKSDDLSDFAKGNAKARARCSAQYSVASEMNLMVGGSDNANEATVGYFTKAGDGFFDICAISGLTKAQEIEILRFLDAPSYIIDKNPTADLLDEKPAQPDEVELGLSYAQTNAYLIGEDIGEEATEIIEQLFLKTEHKRQLPITPSDVWWK